MWTPTAGTPSHGAPALVDVGGVFAPVLAGATPVRGIIVYGTPAAAPQPYPGRSERFFRELAALDVPAAWSAVDARVLSVYGEFDELAPRDHHVRIAEIVNARHPGRAILKELKGLTLAGRSTRRWKRAAAIAARAPKCRHSLMLFSDSSPPRDGPEVERGLSESE